jgi:hypothetical protein
MDSSVEAMGGPVAVRARTTDQKKKGVGGVAVIGIITVAVIAIAAIALGLTSGDLGVGSLRDRIPFLKSNKDGWVKVEDPEGGFTVEMPSNRQADSFAFPPAQNGRLSGWTATIGTETSLNVYYGKVTPVTGETTKATLDRMVDQELARTTANSATAGHSVSVASRNDTDFRGYPAVQYEVRGSSVNGQYGYAKAIMFLKGAQLYSIASLSIYKDQPQFDRFANSFTFTS